MKRITTTYEIITPESAEQGDVAEAGWEDEDGISMVPDEYDKEDGVTAVDLAVAFLKDKGANQASASQFWSGVWYTSYGEMDPSDGTYENRSFHLEGFTEKEQEMIFNQMK